MLDAGGMTSGERVVANGNGGHDTFTGGAGDDEFTGGSGNDRLVIVSNTSGADTFVDFSAGDIVDVQAPGFNDFEDFIAHASQTGPDTVIDLGAGNSLTLSGVALAGLAASDFEILDTRALVPSLAVQSASGVEDTAIPLDISVALTDTDGSETLSLVVDDIPDGATLSDGTHQFTASGSSASVGIAAWTLSSLSLNVPDSGVYTLTVCAVATEANGGDVAEANATLDLNVIATPIPPAAPTIDLTTIATDQGFIIQGDVADDRAGRSVSSAGDVNGDGFDDLIVGAPRWRQWRQQMPVRPMWCSAATPSASDSDLTHLTDRAGLYHPRRCDV